MCVKPFLKSNFVTKHSYRRATSFELVYGVNLVVLVMLYVKIQFFRGHKIHFWSQILHYGTIPLVYWYKFNIIFLNVRYILPPIIIAISYWFYCSLSDTESIEIRTRGPSSPFSCPYPPSQANIFSWFHDVRHSESNQWVEEIITSKRRQFNSKNCKKGESI